MNILFVCRGNLQRSPTAEDMLRNRTGVDIKVKSAGVNRGARTRISADLIEWADRIYVMMEGIRKRIIEEFPEASEKTDNMRVLGIPDRYRRGEPGLKRRLIAEFSNDEFLSEFLSKEDLEKLGEKEERSPLDNFF